MDRRQALGALCAVTLPSGVAIANPRPFAASEFKFSVLDIENTRQKLQANRQNQNIETKSNSSQRRAVSSGVSFPTGVFATRTSQKIVFFTKAAAYGTYRDNYDQLRILLQVTDDRSFTKNIQDKYLYAKKSESYVINVESEYNTPEKTIYVRFIALDTGIDPKLIGLGSSKSSNMPFSDTLRVDL